MGRPYLRANRLAPVVQHDLATHGLVPEVVDAARPDAPELPDAGEPELHREVRVRPHARGELHAVAPHQFPHPAVDQGGRGGGPRPVGPAERHGRRGGRRAGRARGRSPDRRRSRAGAMLPGVLPPGSIIVPESMNRSWPDALDRRRGAPCPSPGRRTCRRSCRRRGRWWRAPPPRSPRSTRPALLAAAGVVEPLGAHPVERAVGAVVHVHDHLVRHGRVAPDRLHAESQVGQVVPGRDDDGERAPGVGRAAGKASIGGASVSSGVCRRGMTAESTSGAADPPRGDVAPRVGGAIPVGEQVEPREPGQVDRAEAPRTPGRRRWGPRGSWPSGRRRRSCRSWRSRPGAGRGRAGAAELRLEHLTVPDQ